MRRLRVGMVPQTPIETLKEQLERALALADAMELWAVGARILEAIDALNSSGR